MKVLKTFWSWGEKSLDRLNPCPQILHCGFSRRGFIKAGILATASAIVSYSSPSSFAGILDSLPAERFLSFFNTHTGETLNTVYFSAGNYLNEAIEAIQYILRDHRTDGVHAIDLPLLNLLFAVGLKLKNDQPFHIISGYRTPATNAALHRRNPKVVSNSLHVLGKAVDVRLPGCDLTTLRRAALDLKGGGVGYYPGSDFVHLDVGPVRSW